MMNSFGSANEANPTNPTATETDPSASSTAPNGQSGEQLPDLTPFFRAGQQFVEQMQQSNPDLIEQLRSQFNNMNRDGQQ